MAPPQKHVVFDVVGTCMSYDAIFDALDARLGDRLRAQCIKPKLLGYTWFEAAEREYTYLSISGRYTRFYDVFSSLFYRILWMAGVEEPREFASDEDLAYILAQFMKLEARPGIAECFQLLRDNGFTVWAFTAGDVKRVRGYFLNNGIDMPEGNFMSCDSLKRGKPDPASYRPLLEKFGQEEAWFAAAHMWDVSAAKSTGCVHHFLFAIGRDVSTTTTRRLQCIPRILLTFTFLDTGSRELTALSGKRSLARTCLGTWT